jgi:hypothetical protein
VIDHEVSPIVRVSDYRMTAVFVIQQKNEQDQRKTPIDYTPLSAHHLSTNMSNTVTDFYVQVGLHKPNSPISEVMNLM